MSGIRPAVSSRDRLRRMAARCADTRRVPCAAPRGPARTAIGRSSRATPASSDRRGTRSATGPRSAPVTTTRPRAMPRPGPAAAAHRPASRLWAAGQIAGPTMSPPTRIAGPAAVGVDLRDTVDGARPNRQAIARNESPASSPDRIRLALSRRQPRRRRIPVLPTGHTTRRADHPPHRPRRPRHLPSHVLGPHPISHQTNARSNERSAIAEPTGVEAANLRGAVGGVQDVARARRGDRPPAPRPQRCVDRRRQPRDLRPRRRRARRAVRPRHRLLAGVWAPCRPS